jgi:hypothetical protein
MTKEKNKTKIDLGDLKDFDFSANWDVNDEKKKWVNKEAKGTHTNKKFLNRKANKIKKKKEEVYKISITPNKKIVDILKAEIKKSGKTYSVEEITTTISEKLNRLQFKIEYFDQGENNSFYKTVFDNSIFTAKDKALKHTLANGLDEIVEISKKESEKPNGAFSTILKCTITGKFLPPKNYHNFEEIVKDFIFDNKLNLEFEKYVESLEKIDDIESVNTWKAMPMIKLTYKIKKDINKLKKIENLDQLNVFLSDLRNGYIRKSEHIIIDGENLNKLETDIACLIKDILKTSNKWRKDMFFNILINLKKSGFSVFKHGEKKHLFACIAKAKKANDNKLSIICDQIVREVSMFNSIKKSKLLEELLEKDIDKKLAIMEISWLIKEGYIREYSDGQLAIS